MSPIRLATAVGIAFCAAALLVGAADDPIDFGKVRRLHQKAKSGEKLTPEEQAYYERGKAARKAGTKEEPKPAGDAAEKSAEKTSTGMIPLCDMAAAQKYHGEEGGLYGGGLNSPPPAHQAAALAASAKIQPLAADGQPSAAGKMVLLTHGMSNTTLESQRFIQLANADARKNPNLVLVDGAQGGIDSRQWITDKPTRSGAHPWDRIDQRLKSAGVTREQVQLVWMKHAVARVGQYGAFPAHAKRLQSDLVEIVGLLKKRFPNLRLIYTSSRTYAGYAKTELNPEPYAYESAFAVRWLIHDQISGAEALNYANGSAPVILWGPYLWADGEKGRKADDLTYLRADFRDDGTHPSESGQQKVAEKLLKFFTTDETTKRWFTKH